MIHEFTYRRRVEFAETDTAGVAHFAAFFRWMEEAEHALYRSVGASAFRSGPDGIVGMPRTVASCEYLRPARYDDVLDVRLVIREMTERSITYEAEFRRTTGTGSGPEGAIDPEVLARGSMRVAYVERRHDALTWRATALPEALTLVLEAMPERE